MTVEELSLQSYIQDRLGRMHGLSDDLQNLGYKVNELVFRNIESMRTRPVEELPYIGYAQELLKEKAGLLGEHVAFDADYRKTRKRSFYQSEYISQLIEKIDNHRYPELRNTGDLTTVIFDPNFVLYSHCPDDDLDSWMEMISHYREQKRSEITRFKDEIDDLIGKSKKLNFSMVRKLLDQVMPLAGFSLSLNEGNRLVYKKPLMDDFAYFVEYDDHIGMMRGSMWPIILRIAPQYEKWENSFSFPRTFLSLSLESILPGSNWYLRHDSSPQEVGFGIMYAGKVLRFVTS